MRNFDYKLFYGLIAKKLIWIRIAGLKYGISLRKKEPLFLNKKSLKLFGWRIQWLRAKNE